MDRPVRCPRVSDVDRAIATAFPPDRAEDWDHVGLIAGDPSAEVTGVLLALDPTPRSIALAVESGANVLVTHHPAFLKPPAWLTPGRGAAGVVFAALSQGVALISAHTNLDRDPAAQELLPERLGLEPVRPLERALQPRSLVTVYAPATSEDALVSAMAGAGAGRIGDYSRCSFVGVGLGSFFAPESGSPNVGRPGAQTSTEEIRIEMVCPIALARGVVAAAVAAHPYQEPLVTVSEVSVARNRARIGMVSTPAEPILLEDLAARCAVEFAASPRVWGDRRAAVGRIATSTGSAGSLIGDALAAGADVLVAGEVRYHDALDAAQAGLAVIELGHDVSEWPLVGLLESVVRSVPGIDAARINVMPSEANWWTKPHGSDR